MCVTGRNLTQSHAILLYSETCITFGDVNEAFDKARDRLPLVRSKTSKEFANLGDVLVLTSALLAKQ